MSETKIQPSDPWYGYDNPSVDTNVPPPRWGLLSEPLRAQVAAVAARLLREHPDCDLKYWGNGELLRRLNEMPQFVEEARRIAKVYPGFESSMADDLLLKVYTLWRRRDCRVFDFVSFPENGE